MRLAVLDAILAASRGDPTIDGWLALDAAQALLARTASDFGPRLAPDQRDELAGLITRLRRIATEI